MKDNKPRRIPQVVAPRSRRAARSSRRRNAPDMGAFVRKAAVFGRPLAALAAVALLVLGYNALAGSRVFELRNVQVSSASPLLEAEIEHLVHSTVGQSKLLSVDMPGLRQKIEAMPRVRSASVARALPDGIRVHVVERKAAALVRRGSGSIVWLDEDGIELGDVSDFKLEDDQGVPPILIGFAEGNRSATAMADDRDRIAAYRQIQRDISDGPDPLWKSVGEIDLEHPKDVNIRVAKTIVNVHVGGKDFYNRFKPALDVLWAAKRGDRERLSRYSSADADRLIRDASNINFIDAASRSGRMVFGFATPGTTRAQQDPNKQDSKNQDPRKQDSKKQDPKNQANEERSRERKP